MSAKIRVGFVGAGGIAKAHMKALESVEGAEIAAVTDVNPTAAESFAAETCAKVYEDPVCLAKDAGVNALFLTLPPFAHGPAERAALDANLPFFVEKPVGLDVGLMHEIAKEVERKGLLTSVGYMNRYRKGVQRAREILTEDPPILGYGGWWGGSPGGHPWWTDRTKSGGQFHEQVTHTVDLARYFFGEPVEVFAAAATGFNNIPGCTMDDAATVVIRFANGGVANLMASVSSNAGGGVFLNVHSLHHNLEFRNWEHDLVIKAKGDEPESIKGEPNIFAIEDAAFIEAVRSGDRSLIQSNYADGIKSAELSLAANKSIETGEPVAL